MNDLISRQAAIDALRQQFKKSPTTAIRAMNTIEELPSAQPEQRWIPVSDRLPEVRHNVFGYYSPEADKRIAKILKRVKRCIG